MCIARDLPLEKDEPSRILVLLFSKFRGVLIKCANELNSDVSLCYICIHYNRLSEFLTHSHNEKDIIQSNRITFIKLKYDDVDTLSID